MHWLARHPEAPGIYESGVRYHQPANPVKWQLIPEVLKQGWGNCAALAPWRAAELRVRHDIKARVEVVYINNGLWHVFVRLPDGRAEDPSSRLGMPVPEWLKRAKIRQLVER